MAAVALVLHRNRPRAAATAKELVDWLADQGHDPRLPHPDAEQIGRTDLGVADDQIAGGTDLVVSLGGDGNMLRAVRLAGSEGVPVLGINFGQLGYLTAIEPQQSHQALESFFRGEYQVQERMTLQWTVEGDETVHRALNEGVVEKIESGKVIRLGVHLNDDFFTTYAADGLIVATPTGSTAYSFSARGPIIDPTHRALLVTPVAPHMLFDRSLVLAPEDEIRIEVLEDREAALAIDGRIVLRLPVGARARCTASPHSASLVTFGEPNFHELLKTKFQLNDR